MTLTHTIANGTLAIPRVGERSQFATPQGSADALLLAELAGHAKSKGRLLGVICADAADANRLKEEMVWFAPELRLALLPDWETLPFDHFSPHQDLISERLETLYHLSAGHTDVLLVAATTACHQLAPRSHLAAYTFFYRKGDMLNLEALREQLGLAGYAHVSQVVSPGEFSIRGGLIDLFPMGSTLPYRIDLFDDEIESLRTFDTDTQRTIYPVNEIRLLPAREFALHEESRAAFRKRFRERFEGDPTKSQLYKDVGHGIAPGGIEYYLRLFFDELATLADYLPSNSVLVLHGELEKTVHEFWRETEARYRLLRGEVNHPLLEPKEVFIRPETFFGLLKPFSRIELQPKHPLSAINAGAVPNVQVDRRAERPLAKLTHFINKASAPTLICAESLGRRETMLQYFRDHGLDCITVEHWQEAAALTGNALALVVSPLHRGFTLPATHYSVATVITEAELYANVVRRTKRARESRLNIDHILRDLSELKVGDPVVHEQHGIGRYQGLVSLDLGDGQNEFLHLAYASDAQLYVPVSNLHLISRYSGMNPENAPLHALGSGHWDRQKKRAAEQARDTAAELLNLYAQRAARKGHRFTLDEDDYAAFSEGFGFEETPDQQSAILAVTQDMTSGKPMDRLVCGDVGFGKTEVAMRAAFIALMDGKQVAILVPTTLLAEQHFLNFSDRLADWPIRIAELSRFRSKKEVDAALKGMADGTIDLVIGTHRLIQEDVQFKRLGLVIIDEEHRFGVRQKEQLKRLRAEVDVLTLTATPIPRTLAMSMEGLRDFSVIATAPQRRLSIKTFVHKESAGIIREACVRELKRGGQIYFLHNEIDTIENQRQKLTELIPEARIVVGHGQMGERELEQVMRDFYAQRANILLCSTIIETGIDVPSANTIIIHRADRFGLAQLHQLRGRVGRSHHQAYAYMLTPNEGLSVSAKKRLEAIQMMEDLGSGFYLAMHDLEIRGAGEVLGDSQSGEMQEIGFSLYSDMLKSAVSALKAGREPELDAPLGVTTEINLHAPALLPEAYCGDVHERLVIYKRLANCDTLDALEKMEEELIDRFGLPPEPTKALFSCHQLRLIARPLGVLKIDSAPPRSLIHFTATPGFEPIKLIAMIQKDRRYQLSGPTKVKIERAAETLEARVNILKDFFKALT